MESHLIEVIEGKDPTPVMEAIANYTLGVKPNIPTAFPEGAVVQQFTIKFQLLQNGKKTRVSIPEILEVDMESLGFVKFKESFLEKSGNPDSEDFNEVKMHLRWTSQIAQIKR